MIKYIHGSEDSIDTDVYCVFDRMPSYQECQKFCSENPDENRNVIVINDGVVTDCFKGTPDEINNGLYRTYHLHAQSHPLTIYREVKRDLLLKCIRVLRCFLSHCSRTEYRTLVKAALVSSDWHLKIEALEEIDLTKIQDYGKNRNKEDIYKTFAFQLGQVIELFSLIEVYTKSEVAKVFPEFEPFLYRKTGGYLSIIQDYKYVFYCFLKRMDAEQRGNLVYFPVFNKLMDVKNECYK